MEKESQNYRKNDRNNKCKFDTKEIKVIVSLWPSIGDAIFASPVFRNLKKKLPNAKIDALVFSNTVKELLKYNPYINEIIRFKPSLVFNSNLKGYDIGVQCSFPIQWLFLLKGIKKRFAFNNNPFWWFYPAGNNKLHSTHYFLKAIEKIDNKEVKDNHWELFLSEKEEEIGKKLLEKVKSPKIAIHPGGKNNPAKLWGTENFIKLIKLLIKKLCANIILIGNNDRDKRAAKIIKSEVSDVIDFVGKLKLLEAAAVIKNCDLFIGHASGPIHIASALNVPVVGIYGPDSKVNFGPLGDKVIVVTPKIKCSPCFHFYRNFFWGILLYFLPKCRAIKTITVEEVFFSCKKLL